jgi:hypothetical protein
MKAHNAGLMVALGSTAMLGIGYGCAFNPFAPPDFDERPGAGKDDPISSSSTGGAGGHGGSSGEGGSGGMPCMCEDDNNECTTEMPGVCPGGDAEACHTVRFGAQCMSGRCNEMGECVSCLMCDSPECMARCEKMACTEDGQCAKGYCEQNTCCNEECVGPCRACNHSKVGECTRLPLGLQVPGCNGMKLCDAGGECVDLLNGPLGNGCTDSSTCVSGSCLAGTCRSSVGEPCVEHIECVTNLCDPDTKRCRGCEGVNPGTCPNGSKCLTGLNWCQVFPGQPADKDEHCAKGIRSRYVCALPPGSACTTHAECQSRNCIDDICSASCTNNAQCAAITTCDLAWSMCKLPEGELCHENSLCQSNNCSGFPRRCQP